VKRRVGLPLGLIVGLLKDTRGNITFDGQLALLREPEPVPRERLTELLTRRLEATREALTRIESISAERLLPAEPRHLLDAPGDGRVEFTITYRGVGARA
jgi:hypothetical protein